MCGKFLKATYGTRDAAQNWEYEYREFMTSVGFLAGKASPCVFFNKERNIRIVVHGDDFTTVGGKQDLDWFEARMQEKYELTLGPRLGPGAQDAKEGSVLNRIVRWTASGLEYEGDPRQGEKAVLDLSLDGAKSVATPGTKITHKVVSKDCPLPEKKHTAF